MHHISPTASWISNFFLGGGFRWTWGGLVCPGPYSEGLRRLKPPRKVYLCWCHEHHNGNNRPSWSKTCSRMHQNAPFRRRKCQKTQPPRPHFWIRAWCDELCESTKVFEYALCNAIERSMRISHTKHVTNDEVVTTVVQSMKLLAQVKSRKLKYFDHVTRHNSL